MKKKIIYGIIILGVIIGGSVFILKNIKVTDLIIDIDSVKSSNIKIAMEPGYNSVVKGNMESKIKLVIAIVPKRIFNKSIKWVVNESCAEVNDKNEVKVTSACNFEIYAQSKIDKDVKSNIVKFNISK